MAFSTVLNLDSFSFNRILNASEITYSLYINSFKSILRYSKILSILKSYGFQTFDKLWDESYDNDMDFKKRSQMVLNIVKELCNKSKNEMNSMISDMESVLVHNKKVLHRLYTSKQYQQEFFNNVVNKSFI